MKRLLSPAPLCALFAALFVVLFFEKALGLNLFIFNTLALGTALWLKKPSLTWDVALSVGGAFLSSFLVMWHNSIISIFTSFIFMFVATGVVLESNLRSMHHSLALSFIHTVKAQFALISQSTQAVFGEGRNYRRARTVLAAFSPIAIIVLFTLIYEAANPVFEEMMASVHQRFEWFFTTIWQHVNPKMFFTLIFGLLVSSFIIQKSTSKTITDHVRTLTDALVRRRQSYEGLFNRRTTALKTEYRNAVLLMIGLNSLLLLINLIDINWVWFGFEFQGEYLKQFVHEGTWMLILSILLSMIVVLYYFRGNLNFYKKNRNLRVLTYAWIVQNAILVVSVAIRNYWYIHYYGLAYKRIGVIFFLLATIIGLYIVFLKVKNVRSGHFVVRWNTFSFLSVLLLMTCFNWDVIIAKYNFAHADRAFVHYNFMSDLSEKAFPYLQAPMEELKEIDRHNQEILGKTPIGSGTSSGSYSETKYRSLYMTPEDYSNSVTSQSKSFVSNYKDRHWLEWNFADHRAYTKLTQG